MARDAGRRITSVSPASGRSSNVMRRSAYAQGWIPGFPIVAGTGSLAQEAVGSSRAGDQSTEGTEADRVGGHACVADPPDGPLDGEGPLPLGVEVAIDAGRHARPLEVARRRARAAMLVEGGVVPEDVERLGVLCGAARPASRARSSAASSRSGGLQPLGSSGSAGSRRRDAERPQTIDAVGGDGVAADGQLRRAGAAAGLARRCSTSVVVARRQDLGARKGRSRRGRAGPRDGSGPSRGRRAGGPGRRADHRAPLALDLGGVVAPAPA